MKKLSKDMIQFEESDGVDASLLGRVFRKAAYNSIPCVFGKGDACNVVRAATKCDSVRYVWEEIAPRDAGIDQAPKEPLSRCECCGHYSVTLTEVCCDTGVTEKWCPHCLGDRAKACSKCGKVHLSSILVQVSGATEGEVWCPTCCKEHAVVCPVCGGFALKGSITVDVICDSSGKTRKVCKRCAERDAVACHDCGKLVLRSIAQAVDDELYCHKCYGRLDLPTCSNCGRPTRNTANASGRVYCSNCMANGYGSCVHGYHGWGKRFTFWHGSGAKSSGPKDDTLYLGFELEAGGTTGGKMTTASNEVVALSDEETRFHLERDGSIPQYGFELISAPHTLAAHKEEDWEGILEIMLNHGMRSHDLGGRCGLHVHVTRKFLTVPDCAKIDLFVSKNQTFWERVARRTSGQYARYVDKSVEQAGRSDSGAGRYSAVNFTNDKTVEFRLFRGTLRYETLMGVLGLVDGLCRWIKTRSTTEIATNSGEVARFVKWMESDMETYGDAHAYIKRREADVTEGEI